jgi:mRNA interferase MazF
LVILKEHISDNKESEEYIPEAGDIVRLEFFPKAGHEQGDERPGLILTPKEYNSKTSLAVICPITMQTKGYPFEVKLPDYCKIKGVVLSDQLKNLDWRSRNAEYICSLPPDIVYDVLEKIKALLILD